jgi:pimeloyl-ACP methyl ester carboxylesterase
LPGDLFASEARAKEILDDAYGQCASTLRSEGLLAEAGNARWAADDLDELCRALGVSKIRLIAAASGTEVALDFLRRYSDRVERAVLVAARGPGQAWRLPSVCDTQIRRLSRFVERDSFYAAHIPDFAAAIRAAIEDLDAKPRHVTATDRRSGRAVELTAGGFALQMILQSDLADPYGFASIPAMLVELKAGDDTLFGKRLGLLYNSISNVMNVEAVAVDCAAGADAGRRERIALESTASVLGGARVLFQRPELCQAVGVAELGPETRSRIDCDVPTLFLSGGLDANAPPFQSEEIRWGFPNGTHVVVGNGWQELLPIPTVQAAVIDYLRGEEVGGRQLFAPAFRFVSVEPKKTTAAPRR